MKERLLKKDVLQLLANHPDGVEKDKLWNLLEKELGRSVTAKTYQLDNMDDVLDNWTDEIEEATIENKVWLRLKQKSGDISSEASTSTQRLKSPSSLFSPALQNVTELHGKATPVDSSTLFDKEMKLTVVEVFNTLGPTNCIKLSDLWRLVCVQLGQMPLETFKEKLENFTDILGVITPGGPVLEETYKLQKHVICGLIQHIPISKLISHNKPSDDESVIQEGQSEEEEQAESAVSELTERQVELLRPALSDILMRFECGLKFNKIRKRIGSQFHINLTREHLDKQFGDMLVYKGNAYVLKVHKEIEGNKSGESSDEVEPNPSGRLKMSSIWQDKEKVDNLRKNVLHILNREPFGLKWSKLSKLLRPKMDITGLKRGVVAEICKDFMQKINSMYFLRNEGENTAKSSSSSNKPKAIDLMSSINKGNGPKLGEEKEAKIREGLLTILEKYHPEGIKYFKIRHELSFGFKLHIKEEQILQYFSDIIIKVGDNYFLKASSDTKTHAHSKGKSAKPVGAGWPTIDLTAETPGNVAKPSRVLKQDFISFKMNSQETIDLTDDRSSPSGEVQDSGSSRSRFQSGGAQGQVQPGLPLPSLMSIQMPTFGQGVQAPLSLPSPITAMDCTPQRNINTRRLPNNPFDRDNSVFGCYRDVVVDLTVQPIVKKEFETKEIITQPVYLPRGQMPNPDMVEGVARECREVLANANEYASPDRVEKMLCQRFGVFNVRPLGFFYPDKIPCINEMNRMITKVNAYIYAFVKTRCMCTLHELQECLREFVPNNEEFSHLKLGPLQRFPVVWEQFRFPPDQEIIPVITSSDILEHFRNYLCKKNKWTARLELEDFMNYLVEEYSTDNAFYLGVRIRSLPLAAQVLKKAQRDAGSSRGEIIEHFKQTLTSEIEDVFRKFRANVMEAGDEEGLEVRKHYLKVRPEIALTEIGEKFRLLMTFFQPANKSEKRRQQRISYAIEQFITEMKQDHLARSLVHLAICITNTMLEESAMELLAPGDKEEDMAGEAEETESKPPPRKDHLLESFKKYIERCLNMGALSLNHLDRIEEKLLEDFGFDAFHAMGYGRFLQFILHEAKQVLEETSGLTLGSSSGGSDSDVSFKPQQGDLSEFIKQSNQCGISQADQMENALCHQYGVKDVKFLGHGNINRLMTTAEKHKKHQHTDFTIHYETALVAKTGLPAVSVSKVGMLGHQTKEAAKICLHNCPLLEDLAEWSQWNLVFEPEHGKLKDFIQKYGGVTTMNIEGGKMARIDVVALETKPGHLIKIAGNTSTDHFVAALNVRDVATTCGHLVSLAVSSKGTENMPLALLAVHMKTALIQLHADDQQTDTPGGPPVKSGGSKAAEFVLKCLVKIPTRICVSLANKLFLDPLGQAVGSTKSKQLLLQICSSVEEMNHLFKLGCLLGISEWANLIVPKCRLPEAAIQVLPSDMGELFDEDDENENEESESEWETEEESDIDLSDEEKEEQNETEDREPAEKSAIAMATKQESKGEVKDIMDEQKKQQKDVADKSEIQVEESSLLTMETVNEVGTSDDADDVTNDVTDDTSDEEVEEVNVCKRLVEEIRKDEFGIGIHLSEDGQRLMKVQQERLGRSIDRLSKDLYSKDTHFVLELVQNADDNSYHDNLLDESTDECPSVRFVIDSSMIMVLNNEEGFQEQNIRYLCDVGRSTKGKHKYGYIGQKGIGFKSVFRVTDSPEVHSNGYHIKFDVNSGPMGYILPHWLDQESDIAEEWMTKIVLPLKQDMRVQTSTLAARFHDIHPSLLLFLHRLRKITIENKVEGSVQMMRRYDLGDGIVEIRHSDGSDRWLVVKKVLDASKISLQAKSGVDVESTEVALAFPLKPLGQTVLSQVMPPKQKVFAFLPLRSYGFRFIVQGDFDVPSSREDVDRDSSWNQWLRNEIPTLFIDALEDFKDHRDFSNMEAVSAFLQFVPMEDEILDFFKPVASQILNKLKARPCIPTQPNSQGIVLWKIPSQTVRVRDPLVREVITPELLQKHLSLFYLHMDVAAMLNPTLTACLGIETLTSEHLFQLGKAMIVSSIGDSCNDDDVTSISRWLACMYRSLDEFQHDETILDSLKAFKMLPLSDGRLVSLSEMTVFFPIMKNLERQKNKDPLFYLQQDVNSLHPGLVRTADNEINSQVQKLLLRLGIKQLSPLEIINHHILPVLKSDQWQGKSREVLISYLMYIKEQTDKKPSLCNIDELKDLAQVVTSDGLKNPSREPVHFTCHYGNKINLPTTFPGHDWVLLDSCYLSDQKNSLHIRSWHDFFAKLGVEDFISIKPRDVHLNKENIGDSPWKPFEKIWPPLESYIVKDYYSPELEALIKHNKYKGSDSYIEQMKHLCTQLDQMWEGCFSRFIATEVTDKNGKALRETDTSFSILLRTEAWVPAVRSISVPELNGSVTLQQEVAIMQPSTLYIRSETIEKYLSQKVLYLNVKLSMNSFSQFLGLKNSVTIETVKNFLLEWCSRSKEDEPAVFCTSLMHMKNIYMYLSYELKRHEFQNLLRDKPVYFVPDTGKVPQDESIEVCGKMLNRNELWLEDPTRLFDKYRPLLEEFHSAICQKRTVLLFYRNRPDLVELFKQEGRIDISPKIEEYLELLKLLTETTTPRDNTAFSDVLCIFTVIGHAMVTPPAGMPDEQTSQMALDALKQTVKKKLEKQKVFPTRQQKWVSLEDQPMIADKLEWEKMFGGKKGVHFLDLEDRSKPHHGRSTQRRILTRHQDSQILPEHINIFIEVCGVKNLSACVKIDVTPELVEPCLVLQQYFHVIVPAIQKFLIVRFYDVYMDLMEANTKAMLTDAKFYQQKLWQLQQYFHVIVPAIQKFLIVRFYDVYMDLMEANTKAMLTDAKFYQASKLDVTYRLSNVKQDTFEVRPEKCVISPPIFYFHRDHLSSTSDINHEIARHFSGKDSNCYALLRSFLTELSNILINEANDTIIRLLGRYNADQLEIPDEELWQVEAPVWPEPELEPEPEPEPEPEMFEPPPSAGPVRPPDEEFQLRSWPPVASQNRTQPRKDQKDQRPQSNIWPPPKNKDYQRTVRDLPENVKLADRKNDEQQNKTSDKPGESSNESSGRPKEMDVTRKRKLSEGQTSEQEVKKLSPESGNLGERGQGHPNVTGQGHRQLEVTPEGQAEPVTSAESEREQQQGYRQEGNQSVTFVGENGDAAENREGHNSEERRAVHNYSGSYRDRYPGAGPSAQAPLPLHMGHPIWTKLASDYTYDELGHGGGLPVPRDIELSEEPGVPEVGNWGERLVYQYLLAQKTAGNIIEVIWVNQEEEMGSPFDFEVHFADDTGFHVDYIEVKSTMSDSKEMFQISVPQIKFADDKKENFHIYRIFNAGNPEKVKLIRIHDLSLRLAEKQVKLCMLI